MTMQYEQQNINLEVETALKSFIFDPNSPQSDTSYNDWDAMLEVMRGLPGIKQILIPEAPPVITIPPGTYDMTDIIISGETPLAFADITDVVFQNLMKVTNLAMGVGTSVANTVSNFVFNDGAGHFISFDKASFIVGALAAFPIFDISAASALGVLAHESSFASVNPGVPVFAVDATSTLAATSFGGVQGNNWGGGPGSDPFVVVAPGGIFTLEVTTGDIFWAANNPSGPTTLTRQDDYEPLGALGVVWAGVIPTNVKDALDRIAAVVAGAHGAIP